MKKITTRIVCAGIFLAAALAIGQKMFIENQITDSNQADARTDLTGSAVADGYNRNRLSTNNDVEIADIGNNISNSIIENDTIAFTGEDFVHEDEDDFIGNDYVNNIYHPEDSEKTTGSSSYYGNNSNHTSSGASAGIRAGAGRRTASVSPGNSGGSFLPGGGGGGIGGGTAHHTGDDGKNTDSNDNTGKDTDNTPGMNTGANPNQDNTADKNNPDQSSAPNGGDRNNKDNSPSNTRDPNSDHKDKDNPEKSSMPSDNDHDNKPIGSGLPDTETKKYYDGPPGSEPHGLSQPRTPVTENDTPSYPNTGASGKAGGTTASAIPEPGSILLIGLGSMILLWARRRST